MFSNLIGNSLQHGDATAPIKVTVANAQGVPRVSVQNSGEPIPPEVSRICSSRRGETQAIPPGERGSGAETGLGLFIASEIITSHCCRNDVGSTPDLSQGGETTCDLFAAAQPAVSEKLMGLFGHCERPLGARPVCRLIPHGACGGNDEPERHHQNG